MAAVAQYMLAKVWVQFTIWSTLSTCEHVCVQNFKFKKCIGHVFATSFHVHYFKKAQPFENASLIHPAIGYTLKYSIEQSA